jgi:hypothetical protein
MDQAVMVFDDAAARTTAIPSPIEGMVTYLKDDDSLTKFDGSAFVPVGGLVAVKHALFTGTQSASVTAGNNVAVDNLSITHTMANASNKLIISAYFGASASTTQRGHVGLAVADDGTLIGVGTSVGSRVAVGAGGAHEGAGANDPVAVRSVMFVYEPNDTASHTYTVRAINVRNTTQTLFINRAEDDTDLNTRPRASSGLVIQEVAG